jgi:hypothetical protein
MPPFEVRLRRRSPEILAAPESGRVKPSANLSPSTLRLGGGMLRGPAVVIGHVEAQMALLHSEVGDQEGDGLERIDGLRSARRVRKPGTVAFFGRSLGDAAFREDGALLCGDHPAGHAPRSRLDRPDFDGDSMLWRNGGLRQVTVTIPTPPNGGTRRS